MTRRELAIMCRNNDTDKTQDITITLGQSSYHICSECAYIIRNSEKNRIEIGEFLDLSTQYRQYGGTK